MEVVQRRHHRPTAVVNRRYRLTGCHDQRVRPARWGYTKNTYTGRGAGYKKMYLPRSGYWIGKRNTRSVNRELYVYIRWRKTAQVCVCMINRSDRRSSYNWSVFRRNVSRISLPLFTPPWRGKANDDD